MAAGKTRRPHRGDAPLRWRPACISQSGPLPSMRRALPRSICAHRRRVGGCGPHKPAAAELFFLAEPRSRCGGSHGLRPAQTRQAARQEQTRASQDQQVCAAPPGQGKGECSDRARSCVTGRPLGSGCAMRGVQPAALPRPCATTAAASVALASLCTAAVLCLPEQAPPHACFLQRPRPSTQQASTAAAGTGALAPARAALPALPSAACSPPLWRQVVAKW